MALPHYIPYMCDTYAELASKLEEHGLACIKGADLQTRPATIREKMQERKIKEIFCRPK